MTGQETTHDQLSRFILQHLGSLEESIRKHEHACAERNQLQERLKKMLLEREWLPILSELESLTYQTSPSHQSSTVETQISACEAEIEELKERIRETEATVEGHERKSKSSKSVITTKVKLLEEEIKTVREKKEQKVISETQKALKSAEMKLQYKNQQIEDLENKVKELEAQLLVRQSTKQNKLKNLFKRKSRKSKLFSSPDSAIYEVASLPSKSLTQYAREQYQSLYAPCSLPDIAYDERFFGDENHVYRELSAPIQNTGKQFQTSYASKFSTCLHSSLPPIPVTQNDYYNIFPKDEEIENQSTSHYETIDFGYETKSESDDFITVTGYGSEPEEDRILVTLLKPQFNSTAVTVTIVGNTPSCAASV